MSIDIIEVFIYKTKLFTYIPEVGSSRNKTSEEIKYQVYRSFRQVHLVMLEAPNLNDLPGSPINAIAVDNLRLFPPEYVPLLLLA